jgi:hypothetical protein
MQNQSSSDLGKAWWAVLIFIALPLYAIAAALVLRSQVLLSITRLSRRGMCRRYGLSLRLA